MMSSEQQGPGEQTAIHVPNLTGQGHVTPNRLGSRRERVCRAAVRGHVTSRPAGIGMPTVSGTPGGHVLRRAVLGATGFDGGQGPQGHVRPRPF